jgi:8-oxo-dGTP diphosphatase
MSDGSQPAERAHAPAWPRCGASAAVFRSQEVLLVQRGQGALAGLWSLPGGHIEPGERAREAALREVREETGVAAELVGLIDLHEVLLHAGGTLAAHYLIAVFCGRWSAGQPRAGGDAAAARFVPVTELASYPLTDGAAALIARGQALLIEQS